MHEQSFVHKVGSPFVLESCSVSVVEGTRNSEKEQASAERVTLLVWDMRKIPIYQVVRTQTKGNERTSFFGNHHLRGKKLAKESGSLSRIES